MKAVLISIRPEWCEKIASGKKTIEVRKTRPKLETPFKCYIYCTVPRYPHEDFVETDYPKPQFYGGGKVIGEFTCNSVTNLFSNSRFWLDEDDILHTCLSAAEMRKYANGANGLYGWHISGLKIYDTPKELSAFYRTCPGLNDVGMCWACDKAVGEEHDCGVNGEVHLSRPPQSWCYVEETDNDKT